MSFNNKIYPNRKDWRKPHKQCQCTWCIGVRQLKNKKKEQSANYQLDEYFTDMIWLEDEIKMSYYRLKMPN